MLKEHNNFLSLLLVLVLFAFSKSNAMPIKDVHSFCKETFEEDLCLKHIGSDQKRIVAARDFSDVFLIAASELQIQVNNAITHINNVRRTYVDPLGKERIAVCEKKYETAADSFHKAWEVGQKKSKALADRVELSNRMKAGYEAVSECEAEWSKQGPKQATNAIPKRDVENLCRESTDFSFCLKSLETDPRISGARDLHDVLLIAITLSKIQVDDATTHIGTVSRRYSGPNGKRRIAACKKNYGIASARFQTAWEFALKKSYWDMENQAKIGTNAVVDCENGWRRGGPIQTSPLTLYNMNVFKLSGIILLIFQKLIKP